jgi:hypothetical protein
MYAQIYVNVWAQSLHSLSASCIYDMGVCPYVQMRVRPEECACILLYVCMYVCIYIHIYMCVCIYVCMHAGMCYIVHVFVYACMHVGMCVCVCVCSLTKSTLIYQKSLHAKNTKVINIYYVIIYAYIYAHVYIHICMCVYIYIYIYMYNTLLHTIHVCRHTIILTNIELVECMCTHTHKCM